MKEKLNKSLNKENIKDTYKKVKKNVLHYVKHNRLFLSYVILCFINCFLIRWITVGNWYNQKTIFIDLSVAVFFIKYAVRFTSNPDTSLITSPHTA